MAKVYVLTDAAQVNVVDGLSTLMMKDSVLPANVDPVQLQHLLDNGIAVEGELVGGLEPVYTGDMQTQLTSRIEGATDLGPVDGSYVDDVDGDGPIPAKSAVKDEWVAYAVSKGAAQADAEALTKDQLVERYGAV